MFGNVNVDYKPCKSSAQLHRAADTDMETAANGGIQGIAVNWGYREMNEWGHVDNVGSASV